MGVIFVVIFCAVSFSNYMKNVYPDGDEEMCEGLLNCVMSLYVSGVIGETMDTFEGARFIYDLIYVTFFSLLFGNIVSGIMLDAFASLREAAELLKNDKLNRCYICDVQR